MRHKRQNEVLAGLVVLLGIAAALGAVIWLGAADALLKKPGPSAFFYVDFASGPVGLVGGSEVKLGDQRIGKILAIHLDNVSRRSLYQVQIERSDVQLFSDAQARVSSGIMGDTSLSVTDPGSPSAPPADREHPVRIVGGLNQAINDLTASAKKISDSLDRELDADSQGSILAKAHALLSQLQAASFTAAKVMQVMARETDPSCEDGLLAKAHRSADDLNKTTGDMQAIVADARPKVEHSLAAVESFTTQLDQYAKTDVAEFLATLRQVNTKILAVATDFQVVSSQARQIVMVNRGRIDESIDNLSQVSADLKATAREVRRSPWRLMYQPKPEDVRSQNIRDAALAFENGAEQLDQGLAKLQGLSAANPGGLKADDPELQKVREQLQESFESFSKAEQALWKEMAK